MRKPYQPRTNRAATSYIIRLTNKATGTVMMDAVLHRTKTAAIKRAREVRGMSGWAHAVEVLVCRVLPAK